jgi:hypothetical protein
MTRAPYKRPEIVVDQDGRTHLTKASWNHDTMTLHLLANAVTSWVSVGELAKLVWGRNSDTFRKAVRHRLPALKRFIALSYNHLLVVEYNDARGAASAVKIYDPTVSSDVYAMQRMLADMTARKDTMLGYYKKVTGLSGLSPDDRDGSP